MLKNIIVKIVTSPFAVLGSLAGGGEELLIGFEDGLLYALDSDGVVLPGWIQARMNRSWRRASLLRL